VAWILISQDDWQPNPSDANVLAAMNKQGFSAWPVVLPSAKPAAVGAYQYAGESAPQVVVTDHAGRVLLNSDSVFTPGGNIQDQGNVLLNKIAGLITKGP
jgi:hypothetical protein